MAPAYSRASRLFLKAAAALGGSYDDRMDRPVGREAVGIWGRVYVLAPSGSKIDHG